MLVIRPIEKRTEDPEGGDSGPEAPPLFALRSEISEDMPDWKDIYRLFGVRGTPLGGPSQDLRPYGQAPHAKEICMASFRQKLGKRMEEQTRDRLMGDDWHKVLDESHDTLLRAILERCVQARKEALGPSAHTRHPIIRHSTTVSQGVVLPYTKQKRTFLADASHTVAFADSDGNLRDYFVIRRCCGRITSQLPMFVYMGIIHERLKREGKNSVVYGLHTDIETSTSIR
ncbi:uncharacterized protein BJX67DRAFT_382730 [Aspergillus lucknowensis]|uniref:Fungal-type protein kinase domain-containing protein n=1 Tax=Aspergillus lucknowensis TaxID=176173 RepID=A0ABR4LMZ5_9EURO